MTHKTQPWFVYLLRCQDGSYYVGVATNIEDRVREHNVGQGPAYTKKRRPVKLVYTEEHESYASARKRETQLTGWRRKKKEWLIQGFLRLVPRTRSGLTSESRPLRFFKNPWKKSMQMY